MKYIKNSIVKKLKSRSSKEEQEKAKSWFEKNFEKISNIFLNTKLRNFFFIGFDNLWPTEEKTTETNIRNTITQVSVANALIAGLPGKIGIGVFVCMALEAFMALRIANHVGIKIEKNTDVFKYFALLGGIIFTILYLFRVLLGFAFSIFSILPPILPAFALAEFFVTSFVGVLFWIGFENAKDTEKFSINIKSFLKIKNKFQDLYVHQGKSVVDTLKKLNSNTIKESGKRIWSYLSGDIISETENPKMRGDAFVAAGLGFLILNKNESFDGPLGKLFIKSIKDRWPDLKDSSIEEISIFMGKNYSDSQIQGVHSLIKGKLFENLVEVHENYDGDQWKAYLHKDESYPGSDIIFINEETSEQIEVSLKATFNRGYIEESILKYPDIPILATSEVAEEMVEFDNITSAVFTNEYLNEVTEENYEKLVNDLKPFSTGDVLTASASGGIAAGLASLYPFVISYYRKKITYKQLKSATNKLLPDTGKDLLSRLSFAAVLGPIYGWYVLARFAMKLTPTNVDNQDNNINTRRLSYANELKLKDIM